MIMKIFACRDTAVEAYLQPFFAPTSGSAIRSLTEAVNDPQHQFAKNTRDFSLWLLGDYDDSTGVITAGPPIFVINCVDLVTKGTVNS